MGYRSDVAYAIVFRTTEDRQAILDKITPEQREIVTSECNLATPDRILFRDSNVKWYATRLTGMTQDAYTDVESHEALIAAAKDEQFAHFGTDGEEGVYSLGVYMRLGEDDDDSERDVWGEENQPEGFPDWWELVDYRRELTVGWA